MRFGRGACPSGFLPVFSVDDEEEARAVIVATCSRGDDGNYYSHDLAREQSVEALERLGEKMAAALKRIRASRRQCSATVASWPMWENRPCRLPATVETRFGRRCARHAPKKRAVAP